MKESIDFNPGAFFLTSFLLFLTQWRAFSALGDRSVEPLSTRSRSISPPSTYLRQLVFPLVFPLSFPCSDDPSTLASHYLSFTKSAAGRTDKNVMKIW
jgi:hypothetical protein